MVDITSETDENGIGDAEIEYSGFLTPSHRAYLLGDRYTGEKRQKANGPNDSYERKLRNNIRKRAEGVHKDLALLEESNRITSELKKSFGPSDHATRDKIQQDAEPSKEQMADIFNSILAQSDIYNQGMVRQLLTGSGTIDPGEIESLVQSGGATSGQARKARRIVEQAQGWSKTSK